MDIQLICDESIRESLQKKLIDKGFNINEKAAFVFYEKNYAEKNIYLQKIVNIIFLC